MQGPKESDTDMRSFDKSKYVIFLPKEMWADTFVDIWGNLEVLKFHKIEPFPLGEKDETKNEEEIIDEAIQKAEEYYNKGLTPILIFPLTTVRLGEAKNRIRILAPAFKTRDDVFLVLKKGRKELNPPIDEDIKEARVAPKGQDITTSALAKLYARELETGLIDPIFNKSYKSLGSETTKEVPYRLYIDTSGEESREELIQKDNYHCIVAAGPELKDYLPNPDEWLAVVNLNAWICRRLELTYLVRAVFCSLKDCLLTEEEKRDLTSKDKEIAQTHHQNLISFWYEFARVGLLWLESVKNKCANAHKACIGANIPYPVQAPAITDKKKPISELARDISSCIEFTQRAHKVSEKCPVLKFIDFNVFSAGIEKPLLVWEHYRQRKPDHLREILFDKCVWDSRKDEDSDFSTLKDLFLEEKILDHLIKFNPEFKLHQSIEVMELVVDKFFNLLTESECIGTIRKEEFSKSLKSLIRKLFSEYH